MTRYSRPNMKEHLNETRAWILYYIVIQTSVDENVAFTKNKQTTTWYTTSRLTVL